MLASVFGVVEATSLLALELAFLCSLLSVVLLAAALVFAGVAWTGLGDPGRAEWRKARDSTVEVAQCLAFCAIKGGKYSETLEYFGGNTHVRTRVYAMALAFKLWNQPHYRHGTFQQDMKANLRNVAVPGTGVPLSIFASHKILAYFFCFVLHPLICLFAAVHREWRNEDRGVAIAKAYVEQLTTPQDWFGFWRMNCALASYHALVTKEPHYALEDKLKFLQVAREKGIAVTDWIDDIPAIICKHRNEEGGLGIHIFKNAVHGGDYIIQTLVSNSQSLKVFLPESAPLSTFRVITYSSWDDNQVRTFSCVWRAGLKGAGTDHKSILFDVDQMQGKFNKGISNLHWYQLGLLNGLMTKWRANHDITHHPDSDKKVTGEPVNVKEIVAFAERAHRETLAKVPIVGWDVALTDKGMLMLECNLSCNFFYGTFDHDEYFRFYDKYLLGLERLEQDRNKKTN